MLRKKNTDASANYYVYTRGYAVLKGNQGMQAQP
jgi:hypothetical protein